MSNYLETPAALAALSALAHEHRLAVFRLLVQAGPDGMAAGTIADALALPASSMSFHLAHLHRAGLVDQRRDGRSLIYTAAYPTMNALMGFLTENCCGGTDCGVNEACEPGQVIKPTLERSKS
jgi:DNA-binding transcriptional ArsR family regulator